MTKLPLAILLALAPAAAFAATPAATTPAALEEQRLVRNGQTFVYTVAQHGTSQVIDGREEATGRRFHYVVANNHVSGYIDQTPVEFDVSAKQARELAGR